MNALQSGLHAESHIIRGEDPEALARLSAEYHAEFRPVTARQRDLVDTLVHNQWLVRRLRLTESDLYALYFQRHDDDFEEKYRFKVRAREHPLADSFQSLEIRLLRIQSRLNSLERSSRAALAELRNSGTGSELPSLQFGACPPIAPPAEGPQITETEPSPSPIGFVPSNLPQASPAPASEASAAKLLPSPTPIKISLSR